MPTQSKTAKASKSAAAASFDAFNVTLPTVEVPPVFRDIAEQSAAQLRDGFAKAKTAAEDTTDMVEDSYESARKGALAIGVKALDVAKVNSDASFSLARDLFGAKTFAEVIELQSAFARKQLDVIGAQAKEFQGLAQKYVTDSAKPVTTQVEKTFKDIKAS